MGDEGAVDGLNKITGCDKPDRTADVIFVHGLDGDALSTWRAEGKQENFWPRWLGDDFPDVGVWSLGYAVSSSAWKGNSMPLADRATNTLDQLELDGIGHRPVIFICHSLGGLLVKQMLRHANDFGNPDYQRIADQTRGLVFLSTPHSGSNIANWIKHLGTLLRTTVSVDELEAHHPRLRELNTWFRNHPKTLQIKILVYCEKRKLKGLLVVDESSADPGIPGVVPVPMDDDHTTICKPKDRTAQIYRRAKRLVEEVAPCSSRIADRTNATSQISESHPDDLNNENDYDPARLEQHLKFQNHIRAKIEEELAKETLKPLREGFIEILSRNAGKDATRTVPELVNELFKVDKATGRADPEAMLNTLWRATEVCLDRLEAVGERVTETDIIWKTAKQILGWLTTLAVRSEQLADGDEDAVFDEIDLETLIGVEIYTARKKEIAATFRADDTENSSGNFQGGNQIDPGFFPETGWQIQDIVNQIRLIVWKAVYKKEPTKALTEVDLEKLNETLKLHRTRRRNSVNYHLAIRKSSNHPLLIPDICKQVKVNLPELTIVHLGTEADTGPLLLIGEGKLIALIDEFLTLIEQYQ